MPLSCQNRQYPAHCARANGDRATQVRVRWTERPRRVKAFRLPLPSGQEVRQAMAKENVFIGRGWPIMPTWVRVTVGTQDEMTKFQVAFQKVMRA